MRLLLIDDEANLRRMLGMVIADVGIGVSVAGAVLGAGRAGTDLMGQVARVTFELPHSRLHETEADRIGVELAARAGYDPRAAVSLWGKMASRSAGGPPKWLSNQPPPDERQRERVAARDADQRCRRWHADADRTLAGVEHRDRVRG